MQAVDSFGRSWTAGRAADGLPDGTLSLGERPSTFVRVESVSVGKGGYRTVSILRRDSGGLFRRISIRPPHTSKGKVIG